MDEDKRIVIENLTTRYPVLSNHNCVRLTRRFIPARWLGLSGIATPANRHCAVCWQGSFPKWCLLRLRATGNTFGQRVSDNWPVYNAMNGVVLQNPAGQLSGLADTVADEIAFDLINQGMAEGLIQNGLKKLPRKWG